MMKKRKCELCTKNKARRECKVYGKFICSLCCASLRNYDCEECQYFQAAEQYNSSKSKASKKKHFIVEINEDVENSVDAALVMIERRQIKEGKDILENLLKEHPGNHMVNYGVGVVYAFEEQYDEAIKYFTKATDIFPYFVEAYFNKGVAYQNKLDIKNVVKSFQEVVEIGDPENEMVKHAKDFIVGLENQIRKTNNINLEKYFEGLEKFEKAFLFMEQDEWLSAIKWFKECLAINSKHPQSYGNMGLCYAQLGQKTKALAAFDKALEIDPSYELAMVNKSIVESLEEGSMLSRKIESVDYYKDYPFKKKSYIRSITDEMLGR